MSQKIWEKKTALTRQREKLNQLEQQALAKARGDGVKRLTLKEAENARKLRWFE